MNTAFPWRTLLTSVVYVGSPVSFYLVFRGTTFHNAYPARSHLVEDAVIALVPALAGVGALLVAWARRRELKDVLTRNPVAVPLWAYATYTIFSALLGLGRGNAVSYVAGDLLPLLELVVFYLLGLSLLRDAPALSRLTAWAAASLVITGVIRLALAPRLEHGFGVTGVLVGGHYLPRLFLLQPYAFLLPVALAVAIAGPSRRIRLAAAGAAVLFAALVVVSFERALWVAAAIGVLPAVLKQFRVRPRFGVAVALGTIVAGLLLMTAVFRVAGVHENPISAIVSRLAYSKAQLNAPADSLQSKRGDETRAILKAYRHDPSAWLFGKGLGATYVGPTGLRDVTYASSFVPKHYVFDSYLGLLLRQGALGLGLAVWLVISLIVASARIASRAALPVMRLAAAGIAAAIGALVCISAIEPYLIAHPIALYEGLALGVLVNSQALREPLTDVTVVTVSHGTADLLSRCLESLRAHAEGLALQTVVVDNASSDNSAPLVREHFPEVHLLENRVNRGFAVASNQGVSLASGRYVLLLNSDCEIRPGALRSLVDCLDARPSCAAAGPRLVGVGGKPQPSASGLPNLRMQVASFLGLRRLPVGSAIVLLRRMPVLRELVDFATAGYFVSTQNDGTARRVAFLSGACLMIRREAWEAVGGLDEHVFMYLEDADWCRRARESGWDLWFVPSATIYHVGGASFAAMTGGRTHHVSVERTRSVLYYFDKYEPAWKRAALRLVISVSMLARLLARATRASRTQPDASMLRAILREALMPADDRRDRQAFASGQKHPEMRLARRPAHHRPCPGRPPAED